VNLPPSFPPQPGVAREKAILAALLPGGRASWSWSPIVIHGKDRTIVLQVLADGIKIDGVRMSGSATLAQQVADRLGALLHTPRINDLAWQYGSRIQPQIVWPTSASIAALVKGSALIDAAIQDLKAVKPTGGPIGLVAPVGKPWVLSKAMTPQRATLYGWQLSAPIAGVPSHKSPATPGVMVIQPLSTAHSPAYEDYSSLINLVHRKCVVDGEPADLASVLQDPVLSWLVSHEGPVPVRQPGVPILPPIEDVAAPAIPALVASNVATGFLRVSGIKPSVLCPNRPDKDNLPREHFWDVLLQALSLPLSGMLGVWIAKKTGKTPSLGRWV
jgi:hypothetical protein